MPLFLDTKDAGFEEGFAALLGMKREEAEDVDAAVAAIIADVRARGDAAVIELTARYDRMELTPDRLAFSAEEIAAEVAKAGAEERAALAAPLATAGCLRLMGIRAYFTNVKLPLRY